MRVFWNLTAGIAAEKMHYLYSTVIEEENRNLFWIELLRPTCDALRDAGQELTEALDHSKQTPLAEVIRRFDRFYGTYIVAARWLYRLTTKGGVDLSAKPHANNYKRWESANHALATGLGDLHQRPAYNGRLKVMIQDAEAYQFLKPSSMERLPI
jgi:hypothetical protein